MARILKQVKTNTQNTILTDENKHKCKNCLDTSWVKGNEGMRRCNCYNNDLMERLWKNFGVNIEDIKLIKEYEAYNEHTKKAREKVLNYIKEFHIRRQEKENSLALLGQAGSGKTHLALAVGKALIDNKHKVVYMPYLEAMKQIKALVLDNEEYERLMQRYRNAEILIIDDLFKDKVRSGQLVGELKEADLKHIYTIINYRYLNKMTTIISSECNPEMLLNLDEAIAGRILEMCGPKGTAIFNNNCNYRLKKFME